MGKRIYPLKSIKYWYAYDVEDICHLYRAYRLHPQTVRQWVKNGLPIIDRHTPALIYGAHLKRFLGTLNQSNKCATAFEQMFCLKCRDARSPYRKQIRLEHVNGCVRAAAHCRDCRTIINQNYKMVDIPRLRAFFDVVDVLELYDSETSPVNTHFGAQDTTPASESAQKDLFV